MIPALPGRAEILRVLETLAIGTAGGMLFLWAHLPGGLISGAMIAVGVAAIGGRQLALPPVITQTVLVLLGISLGALVSRQLIQHMSDYPLTIGMLALATFCSTFGSSLYLQRVHGWDPTSALLAGSPGALSQITMLAAEKGADVAGIAVVQTIRVIILTAALPLVLAVTGIAPAAAPALLDRGRLAARPRCADRGLARGRAAAAADQISGELDVRRDARLQRAARHGHRRRRPAILGPQHRAGRHRRADRQPLCPHAAVDLAPASQRRARLVCGRDRVSAIFVSVMLCDDAGAISPTSSLPSRRARWTPCWRWR